MKVTISRYFSLRCFLSFLSYFNGLSSSPGLYPSPLCSHYRPDYHLLLDILDTGHHSAYVSTLWSQMYQYRRRRRFGTRLKQRYRTSSLGTQSFQEVCGVLPIFSHGSRLIVLGFGLCGVPETLIKALQQRSDVSNLTVVSNNAGAGEFGLGISILRFIFSSSRLFLMTNSFSSIDQVRTARQANDILPWRVCGYNALTIESLIFCPQQ